jgi:hypothetical protein
MNWAELPRGSGAPAGPVQDEQTNRPVSTTRYAGGFDPAGGTDPGSIQFSAARFVVRTTLAEVTFAPPSPGSELRASATSCATWTGASAGGTGRTEAAGRAVEAVR